MGEGVLSIESDEPYLRSYAHCSKGRVSILKTTCLWNWWNANNIYFSSFHKFLCLCLLQEGITLLLINLSNKTEFKVEIQSVAHLGLLIEEKSTRNRHSFSHGLKKTVSWIGSKSGDAKLVREEYHLSPKDGDLQSKTMLLNGNELALTEEGSIAILSPSLVSVKSPITIGPLSIKFIALPNFNAPGCR